MLFSSFCKKNKQMPEETGLHSGCNCKYASNPYHVCSEYCFNFIADPNKLQAKKDPASEITGVNRDCRHSANPYHVCSEYCSNFIDDPKKLLPKNDPAEKTGVQGGCRHSSNPYHDCSGYCSNVISEPNKLSAKNEPASLQAEKTGVNRDCRHSSNPYHICSEYCSNVISEPKKLVAKTEPASVQAEITGVNRDCRYSSNPYHVCSEYCFEVISEPKKSTAKNEPETRSSQPTSISTATSVQAEETGVNRDCRYSSNPYHVCSEYCFEGISEPKKSTAKNEPASVQAEKTGVHQNCRHSSNPYHVCSEYCFEGTSEPKKLTAKSEPAGLKAETRSSQPISTAASIQAENTGVHRDCRHSSNPYHVCSEYCFEGTSEPKKSTAKNEPAGLKAETRSSQPTSISTTTSVQAEKTGVNRDCRYSSNPYHVCSEFCFEVIAEPKKLTAKNELGRRHFRRDRKSDHNGRLISV